jgi:hypothetical protein
MSDILALQNALAPTVFPPPSRYNGIEVTTIAIDDGDVVAYVRRRFVPQPEVFAVIGEHVVVQGERLDHIAANAFGDPLLFWRLCDANRALRPAELTETIGRRLRVTMPEGVVGLPHA